MKLGINQAYFLPYIGYFQLIKSVDKFMLYELLNFRLRSWMNRNRILESSSGSIRNITIPIANKSANQLIRDTRLADNKDFKLRKLLKNIRQNYGKAKFFRETFPFLEAVLTETNAQELNSFNGHLIMKFCWYLEIMTEIQVDNSHYIRMENELNDDYDDSNRNIEEEENAFFLSKKVKRALTICREEGATTFVNLPGGQGLYDPELFAEKGIDFRFISPPEFEYDQFGYPFVPYLSIVDVLMHCGKQRTIEVINDYKFI